MRIDAYFAQIRQAIDNCSFVRNASILTDDRGTFEGFVRGDLVLSDGSRLHWREFVNTEFGLHQIMYSFQYMDDQGNLIFRYDNTGHHANVSTFPHHKHEGSMRKIVASAPPSLADVLAEIGRVMGAA